MLQLTTEAADLIRELRPPEAVDDSLLRVSTRSATEGESLHLTFVPEAPVGDQVGESEGLPVCVAPELAEALDEQMLDVIDAPEGKQLILRAA